MSEPTVTLIYFSPTRTTKGIVESIASGLGCGAAYVIDLTLPEGRSREFAAMDTDLVIMGMPVYEEFVPGIALESLSRLRGKGQACILAAVYGNVGFGRSLIQMRKIALTMKVVPMAAGTFIARHSFSRPDSPLAHYRPDDADRVSIGEFASIVGRLLASRRRDPLGERDLPGSIPLMARLLPEGSARLFTEAPLIGNRCDICMACRALCPAAAIREDLTIDEALCLRCFACVRFCPRGGRAIKYRHDRVIRRFLAAREKTRREPGVYIPRASRLADHSPFKE